MLRASGTQSMTAGATIGGGMVLDPFPPKRGRRTPARLTQLTALQSPDSRQALRGLLAAPPGWTAHDAFMRARNVRQPDRPNLLAQVPAMAAGGLILSLDAFERLKSTILAALAAHHGASPELPGLQPERLRLSLSDRPATAGFAGILEALLRAGDLAQDGPWFRLPQHRIALSPQDEKLWRAAQPMLAADRFRPPRVRDIATALKLPEVPTRVTFKRLMRMGQVIEVAPDHFFLRETVAEMAAHRRASRQTSMAT